MSREIDAFEEAPNMVPGEVEDAEQFDPASGPVQQNGTKAKLSFVIAGLLFAGGWGYANREDFKDALGIEPAANLSASMDDGTEMMMHGCCPDMMAAMASEQTACPAGGACSLPTESGSVAAKGMCCEDGRKSAMAAALLKGNQDENADADKAATPPLKQETGAAEAGDTTEAGDATGQQQSVSPEAEQPKTEQQSKKETSVDVSKQTPDEKAVDKKP